MKKLMTLVFVLLAAGCMQAPQTDLEGLKAMQDVSQSAFDARDAAALAAIYTEDGWKEINSQPYKIKGEVIWKIILKRQHF